MENWWGLTEEEILEKWRTLRAQPNHFGSDELAYKIFRYQIIKAGMTREQVYKILGDPDRPLHSMGTARECWWKTYTLGADVDFFVIEFDANDVAVFVPHTVNLRMRGELYVDLIQHPSEERRGEAPSTPPEDVQLK